MTVKREVFYSKPEGDSRGSLINITNSLPKFLCIGFNGQCINLENFDQKTPHKKLNIPKTRNETSAFFVITWSQSDKILYYAAGDGNSEIETYFCDHGLLDNIGTIVAKGTHHGAMGEFNDNFFSMMRPENYVVSAGHSYGHPSQY